MTIKEIIRQLDIKKVGMLILFLIFCVGLGWGIYLMFFKTPAPQPGEPGYIPPGVSLPEVGEGNEIDVVSPSGGLPELTDHQKQLKVAKETAKGGYTKSSPLLESSVIAPTLSSTGNGISFYNSDDNKFYTISEDGRKLLLSNKEFFNVDNVAWSSNNSKAIIEYPDGNKILYDFTKDKQITLDKEINQPVFSNTDNIAYKYLTDDERSNWLVVADPNGAQTNLIEHLGSNEYYVHVSWSPTNEVVALYTKPAGLDKTEVFFIGLNGENYKSLIVDGSHFKGIWSSNGAKLLYSAVSDDNQNKPLLWIADASGDNIGRHKFNLGLTTWADRCVFTDNTTVYCAVPQNLLDGYGLFPELAKNTNDNIYRIDLKTGKRSLLAVPVLEDLDNYSIAKIYISKDRTNLFFWEGETGKIYKLKLQ